MAADIWVALDAVFAGKQLEPAAIPYSVTLNRFLSTWNAEAAQFAGEVILATRDSEMAFEIWRSALPRAPRAPKLRYPVRKRSEEEDRLVARLREVHGYNEVEALAVAELLPPAEARKFYGVE